MLILFGLTNKSTEPKQNKKKRSRRSKRPALYNEQQNLGAAKVENAKTSSNRKPLRRTKRKSTKLSEGVAKQASHLAFNMREAMVKVTKMRRVERRNRETVAIAKTTPAMTLKRLVRPEQVGDLMGRLNRSLNFDLGIDLGTANILIFAKGKGLVLDEPAYIARDDKTGDILALGEAARSMVGRTPKGISVIRPVQAGVIADYDMTEFMLKYFIRSVVPASRLMKTRIIVCVPSGITPVVDVGGGTTDIAVLCDTGVVVSESLRIGGDSFNESIIRYIRRKKRLVIGPLTAEKIKISVGTVDRRAKERTIEVRGRDASSGLPKMVAVNSLEIQRALEAQVMNILEGIKSILEKTPPELVAAINDHGIILTGGGALIDGLDRVITRSVGIASYLVESPRYAVIKGVAKALDEMSQLRDTLDELQ